MSIGPAKTLPELDEYERNRQQLTATLVASYENQWVAISADGLRIIAAAPDLIQLDKRLATLGQNPEHVGLEFISAQDCIPGAAGCFPGTITTHS